MKITPIIAVSIEGSLDEIAEAKKPEVPTLEQVLASLAECAGIVETLAVLQGEKGNLMPTAERARKLIADLQPKEVA